GMKHLLRIALIVLVVGIAVVVYLGWPDTARVPFAQVTGKRPTITDPRDQTIPTFKIADAIGWQGGRTPIPAPGLKVQAFAQGLDHPR
ncbi:hypothetical protein, partial [Clostridium perfringens]